MNQVSENKYSGRQQFVLDKRGKGLGRNETGISKPLKSSLKFDKSGIGYQEKLSAETTTRWWENVYNNAASNVSSTGSSNSENKEEKLQVSTLTDEELFIACGGRTAHKAARHGLRLNGKLRRIKRQEHAPSTSETCDHEDVISSSHLKRKKEKELLDVDKEEIHQAELSNKKKKKSKKNTEDTQDNGSCMTTEVLERKKRKKTK